MERNGDNNFTGQFALLQMTGQQTTERRRRRPPSPVLQPVHRLPQGALKEVRRANPVDGGRVLQAWTALTPHVGLCAGVAEGFLQLPEAVNTRLTDDLALSAAPNTVEGKQQFQGRPGQASERRLDCWRDYLGHFAVI